MRWHLLQSNDWGASLILNVLLELAAGVLSGIDIRVRELDLVGMSVDEPFHLIHSGGIEK